MVNILLKFMVQGLLLLVGWQQPQMRNAQVETRRVTSLDKDIAAIAASASEPTWVGWRETAALGSGNSCCWYQYDNDPGQRGCPVEPAAKDANGNTLNQRPQFPPPSGPARLEAGTEILVMVRLVDKQVERIRTFSDDIVVVPNAQIANLVMVNYSLPTVSTARLLPPCPPNSRSRRCPHRATTWPRLRSRSRCGRCSSPA